MIACGILKPAKHTINQTSIRNVWRYFREKSVGKVQEDFSNLKVNFVLMHCDGRLLPDLFSHKKVDRFQKVVIVPAVPHIKSF